MAALAVLASPPALVFADDAGGEPNITASEYSWPAPLAVKSLLLDIAAAGDRYIVVGERGHVLASDKQPLRWNQVRVPTRATLTAVAFFDDRLGLAVGHDAVVLRTTNGGRDWQRVHFAPEEERPLLDVRFQDAARAIAVGAYGYYLESRDGGLSWSPRIIKSQVLEEDGTVSAAPQEQDLGDDFHLNSLAISETGRFYVAAEAGTIYRSDDDGVTWSRLPSPYEGSFFGVLPLTDDNVLLFGLRGRVFRSSDAGLHWRRIESGIEVALADGVRTTNGAVVLVGSAGVVLVSIDDGRSFALRQLDSRSGIAAVWESGNADLITVGEDGVRLLPRQKLLDTPSP